MSDKIQEIDALLDKLYALADKYPELPIYVKIMYDVWEIDYSWDIIARLKKLVRILEEQEAEK